MAERDKLHVDVRIAVLTEAGYRCAVPTCRNILAVDIHHIWEVAEGGGDEVGNLIALCPTCHALYHRGTYRRESIGAWKAMLVALNKAFDRDAIELLLLLASGQVNDLIVSGDGLLRFAGLITTGLVKVEPIYSQEEFPPLVSWHPSLTPKGSSLVDAWKKGEREALKAAIGPVSS